MKSKKLPAGLALGATLFSIGLMSTTMLETASAQSQASTSNASVLKESGQKPIRQISDMDVERRVTNIPNGITITMTSTNAATVSRLQAMKQQKHSRKAGANVNITQNAIANGVEITMTSTDAATVTRLQSRTQGQGFGFAVADRHGERGFHKNVQRTVTNIPNGIRITMTSTDAATISHLKERPAPVVSEKSDGPVQVTRKVLDNGVEITMTSTDAATVTRLQNHEKNPGKHGHGSMSQGVKNASQQ